MNKKKCCKNYKYDKDLEILADQWMTFVDELVNKNKAEQRDNLGKLNKPKN